MKRSTTAFLLAAALALPLSALPLHSASAHASIYISVGFGPPPLLWYPQPYCPGYGYYWVPGYWAWGRYGYFWVPGAWVWPPVVGFVWTPGWWGWRGGYWRWHPGYWGRHVGFYGGIAYGHGYNGRGYHGGYWRNGRFHYNRAVTNLAPSQLHGDHSYNRPVNHPAKHGKRVSYNGGKDGINLQPTARQQRMSHQYRIAPTHLQTLNLADAGQNPAMRLANNHGRPVIAINKPANPPIAPRDPRLTNLAPQRNKPANRPVLDDPGAAPIDTLGPQRNRPQPIHRPAGNPPLTPQLRRNSPPARQPTDAPVPKMPPRPIHPAQPRPVATPRPRPIAPMIRPRPNPGRPQPTRRPAPTQPIHRPMPRPIHGAPQRHPNPIAPPAHRRSGHPRQHPASPPA